ncbi:MAG: hypothetical protein ACXWZV_12265, partial [Solirubrobacterales bacterium]
MRAREALTALLLGVLGIAAAAGIAIAANAITGEEIGLSSEPVSVIPAAAVTKPQPAKAFDDDRKEKDDDSGSDDSGSDDDGSDDSGSSAFGDDGGSS